VYGGKAALRRLEWGIPGGIASRGSLPGAVPWVSMGRKRGPRFVPLRREVARLWPDATDIDALIRSGLVRVNGVAATNPRSRIPAGAALSHTEQRTLRGEAKLEAGLAAFSVDVSDRVALDLGASAGGFTRVLLAAGARTVDAVDAGHGQLLGELRQDPRVVNLEGVNLSELTRSLVPEQVDVLTIDLSYLALADALPQLAPDLFSERAQLVALIKPMFELRLAEPPTDEASFDAAIAGVARAFERSGWAPRGVVRSPVTGRRGAVEFLACAARTGDGEAAAGPTHPG
jgi:23S rRNA (cytidine1920-2'-O)/16S rRNA (cytidine1409-2'-O)-methyltransferase